MARPLRIEYPGAYYHIINRGNSGENIFIDERDREKFLEYLAKGVERFLTRIHTYCLMSNHYHLLLETTQANLSLAIQWLNVLTTFRTSFTKIMVRTSFSKNAEAHQYHYAVTKRFWLIVMSN